MGTDQQIVSSGAYPAVAYNSVGPSPYQGCFIEVNHDGEGLGTVSVSSSHPVDREKRVAFSLSGSTRFIAAAVSPVMERVWWA